MTTTMPKKHQALQVAEFQDHQQGTKNMPQTVTNLREVPAPAEATAPEEETTAIGRPKLNNANLLTFLHDNGNSVEFSLIKSKHPNLPYVHGRTTGPLKDKKLIRIKDDDDKNTRKITLTSQGVLQAKTGEPVSYSTAETSKPTTTPRTKPPKNRPSIKRDIRQKLAFARKVFAAHGPVQGQRAFDAYEVLEQQLYNRS